MMTNRVSFRALAALTLGLGALGATSSATQPLAERYNAFGFELFAKTAAANAGKNVIVSPTSVAIALAMAQNGAAADTRAAISKTLHAGDLPDTALNADNAELLQSLAHPGGEIEFSIANSLWIKHGFPVHAQYERAMERSYHAKVANIDFNAAGLAQLNGWVKEHTLGLIPKVLDRLEPLDSVVLANALALKAKWSRPFDPHATSAAPFHLPSGLPRSVSMMRQSESLEYAKGGDWQLVRLPYRGNRFAMYVLLPAPNADIEFSRAIFEAERAELKPTTIALQMPRFVANFSTELNGPLAELGMGIAFDAGAANFSRMTPSAVHISRVAHVTYVRVDEAGTQAAAATAVVIAVTAILQPKEQMIVDHPFYMILRDDRTGQILFLGHINAP